jgi:AAA domain
VTDAEDRRLSAFDIGQLRRLAQGEGVPVERDADLSTPFARRLAGEMRAATNGTAPIEAVERVLRELAPRDADAIIGGLLGQPALGPPSVSRFRGLSLRELRTRPKLSYTVDRWLQADSLALLDGTTESFKTFLAIHLAHCVALGRPWYERAVAQGRVLYLLGEGGRGVVKRADAWQIVHLGTRHDLDGVLSFVVDEMPQLWKGNATDVLAANPGPFQLVLIDTLARAMVGGDENSAQDMGALISGCDDLRRHGGGPTVLILHHLNLRGSSRGSTSLPGAITTHLRLERQAKGRVVQLTTEKQRR